MNKNKRNKRMRTRERKKRENDFKKDRDENNYFFTEKLKLQCMMVSWDWTGWVLK